jgi:hypothetical protein
MVDMYSRSVGKKRHRKSVNRSSIQRVVYAVTRIDVQCKFPRKSLFLTMMLWRLTEIDDSSRGVRQQEGGL